DGWGPVKAVCRRRRGPRASLYRTCHPAILGHRGRRQAAAQPGVSKPGRSANPRSLSCSSNWNGFVNALDNGSQTMNRFDRIWLMLPLVAFAVLPARAQVTIDVSKITCQQYVLFTVADPRDIAMWLSGYKQHRPRHPRVPRARAKSDG